MKRGLDRASAHGRSKNRGGAPKGERAAIGARRIRLMRPIHLRLSALRLPLFFGGKRSVALVGTTRTRDASRERERSHHPPPRQRGRGTTGARAASEPWWRGRRKRSFVFVAEDSLRRKKRANMSEHREDSCGALSPAPPPPPCFAGWSPSPAVAGADGASRFVGAKIPMVKRVLTSPNLCYGGRRCGGRPRS